MTDEARAYVEQQIADERKELQTQLATAERLDRELSKEVERTANAYWKRASKRGMDTPDDATSAKLATLADTAMGRWEAADRKRKTVRAQLARIDDPAELERRVQDRIATTTRIVKVRDRSGNMSTKTTTRASNPRAEVPTELRKRIAKLVKDGMGVSAVANTLNDEGIKRPASGKADWYARAVYNIATKELGVDDLSSVRKDKPLASRAVKDRAPAKPRKLDKPKSNGNGNGRRATTSKSKPASKPAARANGKRTTQPDPKKPSTKKPSARKVGGRKPASKRQPAKAAMKRSTKR